MEWTELKARLIATGLTQNEIAKRSGVPQPTLSLLFKESDGKKHGAPSLPNYLKLVQFYECFSATPKKKREANHG